MYHWVWGQKLVSIHGSNVQMDKWMVGQADNMLIDGKTE